MVDGSCAIKGHDPGHLDQNIAQLKPKNGTPHRGKLSQRKSVQRQEIGEKDDEERFQKSEKETNYRGRSCMSWNTKFTEHQGSAVQITITMNTRHYQRTLDTQMLKIKQKNQ